MLRPERAQPRNFQLDGLPYNQGESEKKGAFVLGSSGRAPTTQYTTDELYDMPYRTVIRLGPGFLGFTSRFGDLEGGDVLALAVFDEANSRWVTFIPEHQTQREAEQAAAHNRMMATENLQEVAAGIILAPVAIVGVGEVAIAAGGVRATFALGERVYQGYSWVTRLIEQLRGRTQKPVGPNVEKSIRSYERLIREHEEKLAQFKRNPTVKPGTESLSKEIQQKTIDSRIRHLEHEIKTFKNNIEKLREGSQ